MEIREPAWTHGGKVEETDCEFTYIVFVYKIVILANKLHIMV